MTDNPRTRLDENGEKYTTLSDRDDVAGLIWDSEMLNWTLFEMAVRLGLIERTADKTATLDAIPEKLVEEFFAKFDHYEDLLCTCGEHPVAIDTSMTGENNQIVTVVKQ